MNLIKILVLIIITLLIVIGCDRIKCKPQFNIKTGYIGIKCGEICRMKINILDEKNELEITQQIFADIEYKAFNYNKFMLEYVRDLLYFIDEDLEIL